MRETANNRRKTLNIFRGFYAGKGKLRVISLYTQLISLKKETNKSVMDYVIRTETILTALRNAGQTVDDAFIIAMKGLPKHIDLFSIHVTHSNKELAFLEFKTEFHSFEKTLK